MPDVAPSEEYFAAVTAASQDVMRILTLDGMVEYMNARGQQLLEIGSFEANRGKLWVELWPPETRPGMRRALNRARQGKPASFTGYCPTAKGKPRWWLTMVSPVRDGSGDIVRLLATSRDMTAERRREEKLRKAVRRAETADADKASYLAYLREAIDALPVGLAFYDSDDRLVIWNAPYVAAGGSCETTTNLKTGLSFEDLLRLDLADGRHPEGKGREAIWLQERLAARRETRGAHEQKLSNGRCYRFEDRRLSDGGIVSIAVDITALKRREAALRRSARQLERARLVAETANRAKSQFLANMSHEIRTPLNGVVGMADLLCRSDLQPRDREIAQIIQSSGETLERLLSDILDIARIEAGEITVESEPFHLGDAARAVAALLRLKAEEKGVVLTLLVDPAVDGFVQGDVVRVRQILTNLISNAVKFTDVGEVTVRATPRESGGVHLSVQDTGVGFDLDRKDQVFRRFQQADGSITRRFGGTGLGLAISRELATLMDGELDCTSTAGVGSTFWADLPLAVAAEVHPFETVPAERLGVETVLRILVADDHPTNRKVVELIMAGTGAEITAVADGAEAVAAFEADRFDVVLMDMQMPVLDGLAAVQRIRRHEARTGQLRTPVIMLTANALPEHIEAGRKAGADGHLAKPITAASLLTAVGVVLEPDIAEDRRLDAAAS